MRNREACFDWIVCLLAWSGLMIMLEFWSWGEVNCLEVLPLMPALLVITIGNEAMQLNHC